MLLGRTGIAEPARRTGVGEASGQTGIEESNSSAQHSKPRAADTDIRADDTTSTGLGGDGPMPFIRADMFKVGP